MNNESEPAVTRVTVVLDSPEDWYNWLFIRKDSCQRHNIWQYVDPETDSDKLPHLIEPSEPLVSTHKSTATSLANLEKDDRESFRWDYDRYERKLFEYRKLLHALAEFNLEISRTVSKKRLYLIQECATAHERLVILRKRLAPDAATRRHEMTQKYNTLKTAPKATKNIDQWLSDWTRIVAIGKSMKLPETDGIRPQEAFLVACRAIDQEYAMTCLRDIYKAENLGITDSLPSLDSYVAEFTAFLRRNKAQLHSLSVSAASLGAASFSESKERENKKGSQNGKQAPACKCGMRHYYADCFIINPENPKKPFDFKAPHAAQKIVSEARKDPRVEQKIQNALKRWAKSQGLSKDEPLQIDDGIPPSNSAACAISISNYLGHLHAHDTNNQSENIEHLFNIDDNFNFDSKLMTMALECENPKNIITRWIVDPGSNTHVINSEEWIGWERQRENKDGLTINAGNSQILVTAWGRIELVARTDRGLQKLLLTHVAFVEGFLTSVIGLARCRKESIHFDSGKDILYRREQSNLVAHLEYNGGHWLIDADPSRRPNINYFENHLNSFGTRYQPSYAPKATQVIDRQLAHHIWGHPSGKAVNNLEDNVNGIKLFGEEITNFKCRVCVESKLTKMVSRRSSEDKATKPFYRIGIDMVYIVPMNEPCWNHDKYMLYAVDEYTKWHEVETTRNKSNKTLIRWIKSVIRKIQRIFDTNVYIIRSDNERGFGNELIELCTELGILFEAAAVAAPEQNGLAERAGGTLTRRARAMRPHGNLPKFLANELYRASAYILNRTPTESLGWKTPFELVFKRKPLVSHVRSIWCQAYALNQNIPKGDKTCSRALIGHLVGYQGTNLFRVWLPTKNDMLTFRDVVFDQNHFFEGIEGYAEKQVIEQAIELLEFPESYQNIEIDVEELLTRRQRQSNDFRASEPAGSDIDLEGASSNKHEGKVQSSHPMWKRQLLTPDPSEAGDNESLNINSSNNFEMSQEVKNSELSLTKSIPGDCCKVRKPAPYEINLNLMMRA